MRIGKLDNTTPFTFCYSSGNALARAHRIAESLQGVLLRTSLRPTVDGLAVESFYEAALDESTVGGDSLDVFQLKNGRTALVVVDASGKGLAAAERVAEIRFALRAYLREHDNAGYAIARLNDFVFDCQTLGGRHDGSFATLTLAIVDTVTGQTQCLCAGGESPVVLRSRGAAEVVECSGTALGVMRCQNYDPTIIYLDMGDSLLLVTDGITESRSIGKAHQLSKCGTLFLGLEGVARLALMMQQNSESPYQIARSVFEGARAFAGGEFRDDACILIAQRQ